MEKNDVYSFGIVLLKIITIQSMRDQNREYHINIYNNGCRQCLQKEHQKHYKLFDRVIVYYKKRRIICEIIQITLM